MKCALFLLAFLSFFFLNQQQAISQSCTDPEGCSAVSFVSYQHTVGVVQFGNSTGKVISKKKVDHCPEANCNTFFTMTTALVAPRSSTTAGNKAVPAEDVTLIFVRRALSSSQTGVFRSDLQLAANGFKPVTGGTKFSGFPFSMGFGNNAIAFLQQLGTRNKIVSNLFNPTTNTLSQPIVGALPFANFLGAAINRDGSLVGWANRKDQNTVDQNFRPLNPANRKPTATPETIGANLPINAEGDIQTISSIAISDPLRPADAGRPAGPSIVFMKRNFTDVIPAGSIHKADRTVSIDGNGLPYRTESEETSEENSCEDLEEEGPCEEPLELDPPVDDNITASSLGPPKTIVKRAASGPGNADFFQSVGIDPKGRFVVYGQFSLQCKKWILKYQRISPITASKMGGPRVLFGCPDVSASTVGVYGIHVINLQ